jgi:hypothetical protein
MTLMMTSMSAVVLCISCESPCAAAHPAADRKQFMLMGTLALILVALILIYIFL